MKSTYKIYLGALLLLLCCMSKTNAQTIDAYSFMGGCYSTGDSINVNVTGATGTETLTTYYGDGTSDTRPVSYFFGTDAYFFYTHIYTAAGSYTVKLVLKTAAGVAIDSVTFTNAFTFCRSVSVNLYNDLNTNCTYDTGDDWLYYNSAVIEVDSAGVMVASVSGATYMAYEELGPVGTVYTFKIITNPYGMVPSCPASGIIYDTVGSFLSKYHLMAMSCDPSIAVDYSVSGNMGAALTSAAGNAMVSSSSCTPVPVTLTITHSPKYSLSTITSSAGVPAYTVAGNVITVTIPAVSMTSPVIVSTQYNPVGTLMMGDTINTKYSVSPTADAIPSNNTIAFVDTIRASYDPNEKSVNPQGNITAGTLLNYTITFENTGNDTAHNIHIMDTLSDNVDVTTIKQMASSHHCNLILSTYAGHNVVKFDFPNIMLPDSSNHELRHGFVSFSIRAKSTLAPGAIVDNKAGIYFDINPVVMTNGVRNMIPLPNETGVTIKAADVDIYPNPAKTELTIKTNNSYNTVSITNMLGQVIYTSPMNGAHTIVNVKSLPAGTYIIMLKGASGIKTQQFQKL